MNDEKLSIAKENAELKKKINELKEFLIDCKIAHRKGKKSAFSNESRGFNKGAFITAAYTLNLLKRKFKL